MDSKLPPASPDSISNPRLVRAIAALAQDAGPNRRGEFTRALLKSVLIFEENPRSEKGFHHRTKSGLVEVFTDIEAYRRWRPRPPAGHALGVREAADLIANIIEVREDGMIINPGGPATISLSCKGSAALLLLNRYPIFWI